MAPPKVVSHTAKFTRDRQALAVKATYQHSSGFLLICDASPSLQFRQALAEVVREQGAIRRSMFTLELKSAKRCADLLE